MYNFNVTAYKNNNKQQGQVLLFVVVAITITMAISIGASVRTLSTLQRTTRTDTSSKVTSASEGGAERFLQLSTADLTAAVAGTCPTGSTREGTNCIVQFDPATGDTITPRALVSVETFSSNKTLPTRYEFYIEKNSVKEINLEGYSKSSLKLCWSPDSASQPTNIYYYAYTNNGVELKGGVDSGSVAPDYSVTGFSNPDSGESGYDFCKTISSGVLQNAIGLRIRSIGGVSRVAAMESALPSQGFKITSVGELLQDGAIKSTKRVVVYKSYPYATSSGILDFSIYSEGILL